jgi:hypothetical protein
MLRKEVKHRYLAKKGLVKNISRLLILVSLLTRSCYKLLLRIILVLVFEIILRIALKG